MIFTTKSTAVSFEFYALIKYFFKRFFWIRNKIKEDLKTATLVDIIYYVKMARKVKSQRKHFFELCLHKKWL